MKGAVLAVLVGASVSLAAVHAAAQEKRFPAAPRPPVRARALPLQIGSAVPRQVALAAGGAPVEVRLEGRGLSALRYAGARAGGRPAPEIAGELGPRGETWCVVALRASLRARPGRYLLGVSDGRTTVELPQGVLDVEVTPAARVPTAESAASRRSGLGAGMPPAGAEQAQPRIERVSFSPSEVALGGPSTVTVALDSEAPAAGVLLDVVGLEALWVGLPKALRIEAGSRTASLQVATNPSYRSSHGTETFALNVSLGGQSFAGGLRVTGIPGVPVPADPCAGYRFAIEPATVEPEGRVTGTIALACPAPAGGAAVRVVNHNPDAFTSAEVVSVPAGQSAARFEILVSGTIAVDYEVNVETSYQGPNQWAAFRVVCPKVAAVSLASEAIESGSAAAGTVSLDRPARPGGARIHLEVLDGTGAPTAAAAASPRDLVIPEGRTSAPFTVSVPDGVAKEKPCAVVASGNGSKGAPFLAWPSVSPWDLTTHRPRHHPPWVFVSDRTVYERPVDGRSAQAVEVYLNLNYSAPKAGFGVKLTREGPEALIRAVTAPDALQVPAGTVYHPVQIATAPVSEEGVVRIRATDARGVSHATAIRLALPAPLAGLGGPETVAGGEPVRWYAYLTRDTEVGPAPISLSSSDAAVASVPPAVEIAVGQRTSYFPIQTSKVSGSRTVTITATDGKAAAAKTLTVQP